MIFAPLFVLAVAPAGESILSAALRFILPPGTDRASNAGQFYANRCRFVNTM
jgi:hypothetical protein